MFRPDIHANHTLQNYWPVGRGDQVPPYVWSGNWTVVIRDHLGRMVPKPDYVVFNAGLWPHDLNNDTGVLEEIRQALDDSDMMGIYKTTTKVLSDNTTTLEDHDVRGCQILHYCLNIGWTGEITDPNMYLPDGKHFKTPIYQQMNVQLLEMLASIRQEHPQHPFGRSVTWQ